MIQRVALAALLFALTLAPSGVLRAEVATGGAEATNELAAIGALADTLLIGDVVEVMRVEGIDYGATLEDEMFPGAGGPRWQALIALIYDGQKMRGLFDAAFARSMAGAGAEVAEAQAFFGSDLGQRILKLEIEARRALLDEAVEEAAKVAVEDMIAAADPRMEALRQFALTNDLIESNVMGALNANLAFYRGMAEGEAFGGEMTEEQMLEDVWGQEPDIRAETEGWLFPFLALAYKPLSDDELAAYQAFSETPAGQRLNAALFSAFDAMFVTISGDLGRAAARQMQGEDI